ncbi:MAG: GHKL domain-containing protein [Betaproteobacteria bacterium]|nr:MAG: GHKL domain-containing protein [Betaproteobacteria bacterium]
MGTGTIRDERFPAVGLVALSSVPMLLLGALALGAVIGIFGVTAARFRRENLERAALRRALASSSDWWWRTDPQLRVVETEFGRGGPSGLDLGSLLGRAPWQLQSGAQAALPPPALAEAVARRLPFHDVELEAKTDKARALRLSGAPLYSASGRYCGYAGVASLLTDSALSADRAAELQGRIRQLEADNLARMQRHELAVRELDSFAYSVSHDLRAPLRVIDGFAQIVLEDYGERLDALGREHVKRILAAAGRMNSMIETLLAMSRMTGRELQFERVDLSETARQLAEELKAAEPGRQIEVTVQPGLSVEGDRTLLRLVLQNLLGNAFKFSAKTPEARIEFGCRADGDHAFFVRDNGAGFDMRFADRLFGAFQRLHSQSEFAGTGVGLATVQRIVRRHSGRIWAESEPGKGATFFFTMWDRATSRAESN